VKFSNKPILLTVIRCFLGSTFLVAGVSKLFPLNSFLKQVIAYRLPLPEGVIYVLSVCLITLEIWIGLSILLNSNLQANLIKAQVLLLSMIPATVWASFHKAPSCGCYGNLIQREPWQATIEDCLLLAVTFILLPSPKEKSQQPVVPIIKKSVIACLSCAALVYGFVQLQAIYAFQAERIL
jgi:uncharacterized membrane protein